MSKRAGSSLAAISTHPHDFDRGDGYVPSPNVRRELLRQALDRHARQHVRVRLELEHDRVRTARA